MGKLKDITGQRFGRLVVVEDSGERRRGNVMWKCACDCGKVVIVRSSNLIQGITKSCGCLNMERIKEPYQSEERKERARLLSLNYLEKRNKTTARTQLKEGTRIPQLSMKTPKSNTSGIKGVYWIKSRMKWRASIGFKNKNIFLGEFQNKQDAINARKEAEEKYFKPILEKYGKTL